MFSLCLHGVFSGYSCFPPQSKNILVRLTGKSKLSVGVRMDDCLSLCVRFDKSRHSGFWRGTGPMWTTSRLKVSQIKTVFYCFFSISWIIYSRFDVCSVYSVFERRHVKKALKKHFFCFSQIGQMDYVKIAWYVPFLISQTD